MRSLYCTVEPRYNEGLRDWKLNGVTEKMVRQTDDFVILRFHCKWKPHFYIFTKSD